MSDQTNPNMNLKLKRKVSLMQFTSAAEVQDDSVWHVNEHYLEGDRVLCGIAHEGLGNARYGIATHRMKVGQTTNCPHCIAMIKLCKTL